MHRLYTKRGSILSEFLIYLKYANPYFLSFCRLKEKKDHVAQYNFYDAEWLESWGEDPRQFSIYNF